MKVTSISIKFEPRDLWIGVFWTFDDCLKIYICIVPTLPIRIFIKLVDE